MNNSSKDSLGDNSSKDTLKDSSKEEMRHSGEGDNLNDKSKKNGVEKSNLSVWRRFFYNPYTIRILGGLFVAGLLFLFGVYRNELINFLGIDLPMVKNAK